MKFKQIVTTAVLSTAFIGTVQAGITLRHALLGTELDMSFAKKGGDTDAFKEFMKDGKTLTTRIKQPLKKVRTYI